LHDQLWSAGTVDCRGTVFNENSFGDLPMHICYRELIDYCAVSATVGDQMEWLKRRRSRAEVVS